MKLRNRILAVLLTLALILSVAPVAFAAEQVTVTLSTPGGNIRETMPAGSTYTFPGARDYDGYYFVCWSTQPFALTEVPEIDDEDIYYEGDKIEVDGNVTFYGVYWTGTPISVPLFYWTGNLSDYSGEFAIVGFDADYTINDFDYATPQAMGENGQTLDVWSSQNAVVYANELEFISSATNFVYDFRLQSNGTYTIRNIQTKKYLSVSGTKLAFVSNPDAYSYWNITIDSYGYETIVNAKESKLVLLYDYTEGKFGIFDDSRFYEEDYYPTDLFFIAMYARQTMTYKFGTEISGFKQDHDCSSLKYMDLDLGSWYHSGVDFMLENGFMNGVNSDTFRPNGTLNRAMVATVMYRIAGQPAVEGSSTFSDVADGTWYTDAVIWAQANGIVTGYNDGTFRPTKEITRQEMAVMLARYAKLWGMETDSGADLSAYPDAGSVASWAAEAMQWCVAQGLINGVQSGGVSNLKPGNNATRAQFATIMARFMTL